LSTNITKESNNLRKQLKKFNSSVDILRQKGRSSFSALTWEVSDVSSGIYSINIPDDDTIPLVVKRAAERKWKRTAVDWSDVRTFFHEMH